MRIERIETGTKYLPVLFIKKDKPSEVSEIMQEEVNMDINLSTEESSVNVLKENITSVVENDDTSDKTTEIDSMDNLIHKEDDKNVVSDEQYDSIEEKTAIHDEENNDSDNCSDDTVNNENHDAEVFEPITVDDESAVNSDAESNENAEDTTEEPVVVEKTNNSSIFRSEAEDSNVSSFDKYEEVYGDMIAPRIEKIKKKVATPTEKFLNKKTKDKKKKTTTVKNTEIVSQSDVIDHHFELNGFLVVESSKPQNIEGLKNITFQIAENFSNTAPLLKEVRKAICKPNAKGDRTICFKFDRTAGSFYHEFCFKMKQYGLFTKYFIDGNTVNATITSVPRVISYLNGQWLEMYASFILEDVVSDYAKANGYKYEILTNLKVANITSVNLYAHEIDCVISIGDKCFAFEVKSGNFDDYSNLYKTRKDLHFVPDRYLLLSTELNEESAEVLQYFYEFYITEMCGFKNRLIEMINKAFDK